MVTSNPKKPGDLLFLMPVQMEGERLRRGQIRLLAADADGKVYASVVSRSVYELAQEKARDMQARRQPYAIVGLETSPGRFLPTAVGIGPEELWALEHISEHALRNGTLPDILKKYVKPIIGQGETRRGATQLEEKERRRKPQGSSATTPHVMERLPYYPDQDIEFSMPIYKASHSYPFVVLKRLVPQSGIVDGGRLLILDNDGDLGVIKLPMELVRKMERNLKQRRQEGNYRAVIARDGEGTTVEYLAVSQQQSRALDTITRYFEETGSGKPLSMAAKSVLTKARGNPSVSAD